MWETIGRHKNIFFAIILVVLMASWLSVPKEELEELDFIITVDYDCREIARDSSDIPTEIVEQCRILINELRKNHAPKTSERGTST